MISPSRGGDLELELDDLELELGLDRDLGLPLSGAPGGDDGVLDPMSLPGAAVGLLDGARRVRFEFDGLLDRTRRVRFEFEFEFEFGVGFRVFHSLLCSIITLRLRFGSTSSVLTKFSTSLVISRSVLRRVLLSTIFPYCTLRFNSSSASW